MILFPSMSVHPSLPHRQAPSEGRSAVVMVAELIEMLRRLDGA
jgi:hypothetical protein